MANSKMITDNPIQKTTQLTSVFNESLPSRQLPAQGIKIYSKLILNTPERRDFSSPYFPHSD